MATFPGKRKGLQALRGDFMETPFRTSLGRSNSWILGSRLQDANFSRKALGLLRLGASFPSKEKSGVIFPREILSLLRLKVIVHCIICSLLRLAAFFYRKDPNSRSTKI